MNSTLSDQIKAIQKARDIIVNKSAGYIDDLERVGGYEFKVQKNPTENDRSLVSYWVGVTHWMLMPTKPE